MRTKFALIGCGGMGFRHLLGYIEYLRHDKNLDLVALVDFNEKSSSFLSDQYYEHTGKRLDIFKNYNELITSNISLDSVDIATTNDTHHEISSWAMKQNLHVMCEKPVALSIKLANELIDVQNKSGKKFAVFENFRRDPINRFTKFIIDSEKFGEVLYAYDFESSFSQGKVMHGTGWRAKKNKGGGIVLDAGIHNADLLLYFLGPVKFVNGQSKILLPQRKLITMEESNHNLKKFYGHRIEDYESSISINQDAVDTVICSIVFESGALGSVLISDAIPNLKFNESWIHGSKMSLKRSNSRSGKPISVKINEKNYEGAKLFDLFPNFELDSTTQQVFGNFDYSGFDISFEDYDKKLIALEYLDFINSLRNDSNPEVGIIEGISSLSLAYSFIESGYVEGQINMSDFSSNGNQKYLI